MGDIEIKKCLCMTDKRCEVAFAFPLSMGNFHYFEVY